MIHRPKRLSKLRIMFILIEDFVNGATKRMRIEELYVWSILLKAGISDMEQYATWLDDIFLKAYKGDPSYTLLLDLEFCSNDINKTLDAIDDSISIRVSSFDFDYIGSLLFKALEEVYSADTYDLQTLAAKAYYIWTRLPERVANNPPFFTLNYIDDPLDYGDEATTRDLFQSIFDYYRL